MICQTLSSAAVSWEIKSSSVEREREVKLQVGQLMSGEKGRVESTLLNGKRREKLRVRGATSKTEPRRIWREIYAAYLPVIGRLVPSLVLLSHIYEIAYFSKVRA